MGFYDWEQSGGGGGGGGNHGITFITGHCVMARAERAIMWRLGGGGVRGYSLE